MSDLSSIRLFPAPKHVSAAPGVFELPSTGTIKLAGDAGRETLPAARRLQQLLADTLKLSYRLSVGTRPADTAAFRFSHDPALSSEAYTLHIADAGVAITYADPAGAFYAAATLKQLLVRYGRTLPCLEIKDQPDFPNRGLMIDISRNKIPKPETLLRIVDLMADLKLNQLQLYIEGSPFAYESFPQVWELETPLSGEEILSLDAYCRERYIQLVPNQNSFGHMEDWLSRPEFNHLAEIPEGFMLPDTMFDPDLYPEGLPMRPGTFNTLDPEVPKLLSRMYDDLLPYFTSPLFNVGCDETYELGLGRSKAQAESEGKGKLYLSFLQMIRQLAAERGKTMQFWGDIIIQYPELIPQLPKDIIAMEWGYAAEHPFEDDTQKFRDAGIPFYVCPGTSSWNSITGRTDNMLGNLRNAAIHGKRNGAEGYLITDWGDHGHWQQLPVSYAGFVYGAALAWQVENNIEADAAEYLDRFVFEDRAGELGKLLLDMGNYYTLESGKYRPNDTELSMMLRCNLENLGFAEQIGAEGFARLEAYFAGIERRLDLPEPHSGDAALLRRELGCGLHFLKHAVQLGFFKLQLARQQPDAGALQALIQDLDLLLHEYRLLWTERNRPGGLERSTAKLERLRGQYAAMLAAL
ncbi:glycoside hydrolase family 20 zincin-like fold domain-containing protein [Paenibacillus sp. NFR01]|uniref:glycoside hydrolase family 20 zincin-like fold domain-containing protein n=1 Tax=Paenibacillus sp. NFR01 TaxID=1566279 RepID=UPI0008C033C8|nr:glycoside hydrolase family 20 zincin-like fold domain-containing protein [Paenibacillus sp. NFR01]SEU00554.1 Glycosyl hydrolase family 20, catalytic domain [Paenibacillus sp. NFR01]